MFQQGERHGGNRQYIGGSIYKHPIILAILTDGLDHRYTKLH